MEYGHYFKYYENGFFWVNRFGMGFFGSLWKYCKGRELEVGFFDGFSWIFIFFFLLFYRNFIYLGDGRE
jgi:hypothetical protein